MEQDGNNNQHYKCPFCSCIFLTRADLQKHIDCFGNGKDEHLFFYKKTHGRLEHGYGEE